MRIFNNLTGLKENLENSNIIETVNGYDMSKKVGFFRVTLKTDWENLPKGVFLVRQWKGSPKDYRGYIQGGNYLTPTMVDKITFYEDGEIRFSINYRDIFSIHYEDLHHGNDYDIILKNISDY